MPHGDTFARKIKPITAELFGEALDDIWVMFSTLVTSGDLPENAERHQSLMDRDLDTGGALIEQLKALAAQHQIAVDRADPTQPWRPLGAYWIETPE